MPGSAPESSPQRSREAAPERQARGPDPDHDLVALAQQGDERAFESLVGRYQQRAFRIARNMVPSDDDARDLVQEAFLRVFRNLDRFDFKHPFGTWLHRIVTNLAIDHLRRRRLPVRGGGEDDDDQPEFDLPDPSAPAPSRRLEADETAQRVRDCIAALAPHFQSVLVLRELEGMSCAEIAEIVGATHVTVRWRLHRGRKLFQEEWQRRERVAEAERGRLPADANNSTAPSVRSPEEGSPKNR